MTETRHDRLVFSRPNVLACVGFEGADVFGSEDEETYSITNAIDALDHMLTQSWIPVEPNIHEALERWADDAQFKIIALKLEEVRKDWAEDHAELLAQQLRENFRDDYRYHDDEDLQPHETIELTQRLKDVATWYLTRAKVGACNEVASWVFDKDDLLELVQQLRPEWLTQEPKDRSCD